MADKESSTKFISTVLFSAVFLVSAVFIFFISSPYSDGISTVGKVVNYSTGYSSDSDSYNPIIEFQTLDGEVVIFKSRNGSGSKPTIGSEAEVSYRMSDPESARHVSSSRYIFLIAFGGTGLIILFIAFTFHKKPSVRTASSSISSGPFTEAKLESSSNSIIR